LTTHKEPALAMSGRKRLAIGSANLFPDDAAEIGLQVLPFDHAPQCVINQRPVAALSGERLEMLDNGDVERRR
jgi:hypothetical protein